LAFALLLVEVLDLAKKKRRQHKWEPTKHQLSRQQQQKKRQRIFLIVGISVMAVVGGVIGGGWYKNDYLPRQEVVIKVNDTEFNMGYYLDMLKIQSQPYLQAYEASQAKIYVQSLADQVVQFIEENELMRQGALAWGIEVTDHEVSEALKESDPPLGKEYWELMKHDLLVQKLLDEHFDLEVPVTAEQRHIMAMFLESESQAKSTRERLVEGEDFATLASELSLYDTSQDEAGDLGWHPKGILAERFGLSIPEDYAFSAEAGALSQPLFDEERTKNVGYWLAEVLEKDTDESGEIYHIRVMLLGSEEEAQDIRARLEAGEDFATLAEEYSQHSDSKDNGGDLDWLPLEDVIAPLKDFVLNAEVGTISEPVRDETSTTKGGYWLVKVVAEEDNRQISDEDRSFLKTKALSDWLTSLSEDPANIVESYLDSDKKAWAVDQVLGG
jgi:parvulin-like peptidyl-prolyl isomerase